MPAMDGSKKFPWREDVEDYVNSSDECKPKASILPTRTKSKHHQSESKDEQQERVTFQPTDQQSSQQRSKNDGASSIFSQSIGASIDEEAANTAASSWAPRPTSESTSASVGSMPSSYRQAAGDSKKKSSTGDSTKHQPSLTEKIGTSALSSTLGILRLAGGVTLSTTGTILSPSLEITRKVILPSLLGGVADYVSSISPQRLKDWFRIVSASVHHIVTVIVNTEQGATFRHRVVRVGGDLVDVASSDQSRQTLMDGMACYIKFSEALHTPEFKAFLEQMGVLGCRVVDAAAMGKNKTLIHDVYDLIWSGVELANDPATTVAMAEVAAYLCHALEMEDAAIYAVAKEREEINRKAAKERRDRDQYQKSTYQNSYLFSDPNSTVEEVILSALGVIQKTVEEADQKNGGSHNDIPGSVVLGAEDDDESTRPSRAASRPPPSGVTPTTISENDDEGDETDDDDDNQPTVGIHNQAIDVGYLRDKITKRAEKTQQRRLSNFKIDATSEFQYESERVVASTITRKQAKHAKGDGVDDGKKDIEDLASLSLAADTPRKSKTTKSLHFEDGKEGQDDNAQDVDEVDDAVPAAKSSSAEPLKGEAPIAHFYRVLDQVLTNQRQQSVKSAVDKKVLADCSAVMDHDPEANGLKKHIQSLISKKRVGTSTNGGLAAEIERLINANKVVVCASVIFLLFFAVIFFAFGCYGMYVYVFPPTLRPALTPGGGHQSLGGSEIHVPVIIHDNMENQHKNEYIIRVVREVVHVNGRGETLHVRTQQSDEL